MTFPKGKSGNPNGRPPNERAIAGAMRKYLRKTRLDIDGKRHNGNTIFARIAIQAVLTGTLVFPAESENGDPLPPVYVKLDGKDWINWAKEVMNRADGPPRQEVGLDVDDKRTDYRADLERRILDIAERQAASGISGEPDE